MERRTSAVRDQHLHQIKPLLLCAAALLCSCVSRPPAATAPQSGVVANAAEARQLIASLLPRSASEREGWTQDIDAGFAAQGIQPNRDSVCAVIAVIAQESGFRVDPVIPGLGAIAWREIDARAARAGVPPLLVHAALQARSASGRSYADRIDAARTEKDLSDIFEDFIAAVPMGQTLFAGSNPIRTRGPMQVNIAFAEQYARARPYPYPVASSVADELFTRRGSVYFGIAHLLDYRPAYDDYLYRFADYNAGQYASRNAAFQLALALVSRMSVPPDGALLAHEGGGRDPGSTELAARSVAARLHLRDSDIHAALEQGRVEEFEQTRLYQRVFALADRLQRQPLPRAVIPRIALQGPKITRHLTTDWYAHRVDERFQRCRQVRSD